MSSLTPKSAQKLKAYAHALKPVVIIGDKGLTEGVSRETDSALTIHELIKVKVNAENKTEKSKIIENLCQFCNAHHVTTIGHIAILYRPNPDLLKYEKLIR